MGPTRSPQATILQQPRASSQARRGPNPPEIYFHPDPVCGRVVAAQVPTPAAQPIPPDATSPPGLQTPNFM
ncbi:hypothetical protein IMZ48_41815 [Candidatus Bathyarchaeota archaeon]|nr:hypothetical protein [Candidatus Bathyarchaeota archaeon]